MSAWRLGLAVALGAMLPALAEAQAPPQDISSNYKLDFAVPDAPAFAILGSQPTEILRPTTTRDLSLAASDFLSDGSSLAIPAEFAAEFSPGLLIGGKRLSLAQYRSTPWLYRLRVSVATSRTDSGSDPTSLAVGLRVPLIDRADLRTNQAGRAFELQLVDLATRTVNLRQEAQDRLVRDLAATPATAMPVPFRAQEAADAVVDARDADGRAEVLRAQGMTETAITEFLAWYSTQLLAQSNALNDREDELKALRRQLEEESWNNTVLEVAAAALGEAADSTGKDLKDTRYALWGTGGIGFGNWGQFLVGLTGSWEREPETSRFKGIGSLATRLYMGTNWIKGFAEFSGTVQDQEKPKWFLNGGGEVRAVQGLWATFSTGVEWDQDTGEANARTSVALKLGLFNS